MSEMESAGSVESTGEKSSDSPGVRVQSPFFDVRDGVGRFCGVNGREIERQSGSPAGSRPAERESAGRERVGRGGF
jgi:hypothetical protein